MMSRATRLAGIADALRNLAEAEGLSVRAALARLAVELGESALAMEAPRAEAGEVDNSTVIPVRATRLAGVMRLFGEIDAALAEADPWLGLAGRTRPAEIRRLLAIIDQVRMTDLIHAIDDLAPPIDPVAQAAVDRLVARATKKEQRKMKSIPLFAPCSLAVLDDPDPNAGNACHHYVIQFGGPFDVCDVQFQHGPRGIEGSIPGVFDDALLAICEDRLHCFQEGAFSCDENQNALDHIRKAREALADRVANRQAKNVLGINEKH